MEKYKKINDTEVEVTTTYKEVSILNLNNLLDQRAGLELSTQQYQDQYESVKSQNLAKIALIDEQLEKMKETGLIVKTEPIIEKIEEPVIEEPVEIEETPITEETNDK